MFEKIEEGMTYKEQDSGVLVTEIVREGSRGYKEIKTFYGGMTIESLKKMKERDQIEKERQIKQESLKNADILTGIVMYIEIKGFQNGQKAIEYLTNHFQQFADKGYKFQHAEKYVDKEMKEYYSTILYEIEIIDEKSNQIHYRIRFEDGSCLDSVYISDQRLTNLPLGKSKYESIIIDVEKKLIERGIEISDRKLSIPFWIRD